MSPRHPAPGCPSWLALGLLLAAVATPAVLIGGDGAPPPAWPDGLRPGQLPGDVKGSLGEPARVSRQVVAHRSVEQWHYGPPRSFTLTFTAFRGQGARLHSMRPQPRAVGR